jgi:hypothetical protein
MVVLLTEIGGPVDWRLTVERLACTRLREAGPWLAAHALWPSWEKDRFQPLMKDALGASCNYIKLLATDWGGDRARTGVNPGEETPETANSEVFGLYDE